MGVFRFKRFSVVQDNSALKVGTDAVMLGALMSVRPSDRRLLDVGTGTGVIALMAAQRLSSCAAPSGEDFGIVGIDIDAASAEEAALNFAASPWSENLSSLHCGLRDFCVSPGSLDLIFSNPPYYDSSLENPDLRLASARHTGTLSYRDIFEFATSALSPDGRVALILPFEEKTRLLRTAASFGFRPFRLVHLRTSLRKPPRRLVAEFSRSGVPVVEDYLIGPGTAPFTSEFYL